MMIKKARGPMFVRLADGRVISRSDLPPKDTTRWVASRKIKIIEAVEAGLLTADEACDIYGLSSEELKSWRDKARAHGAAALKVTATQKYRQL